MSIHKKCYYNIFSALLNRKIYTRYHTSDTGIIGQIRGGVKIKFIMGCLFHFIAWLKGWLQKCSWLVQSGTFLPYLRQKKSLC